MVGKGKVLGRAGFLKLLSMREKVFEILFGSRNPHSVQKLIQDLKNESPLVIPLLYLFMLIFPQCVSKRV